MDPLELAKNIEQEGKRYYEKLARETPVPGLSGIFKLLAGEEQQHYELFNSWRNTTFPHPSSSGTVSAEAKRIFAGLSSHFSFPETVYEYSKAYSKALEMERKSITLYEDMLAKSPSSPQKEILTYLIQEEQKHEHLVEHLLEFVAEPKTFLENAEFNHLDEE
ncbi:MAG TPA: ferritin family protein [Chitinivibrionales bacterium]|nr:ferritin family protein [Chitinivibrionales bacterium]